MGRLNENGEGTLRDELRAFLEIFRSQMTYEMKTWVPSEINLRVRRVKIPQAKHVTTGPK